MMKASSAADLITSVVKNSKLNFFMQETPFLLQINVRKSFMKTKSGHELVTSNDNHNCNEIVTKHQVKVEKLEQEKFSLSESIVVLESDLQESRNVGNDLSVKLEKAKKELTEIVADRNNNTIKVEKLGKQLEEANAKNKALEAKNRELETKIEKQGSALLVTAPFTFFFI